MALVYKLISISPRIALHQKYRVVSTRIAYTLLSQIENLHQLLHLHFYLFLQERQFFGNHSSFSNTMKTSFQIILALIAAASKVTAYVGFCHHNGCNTSGEDCLNAAEANPYPGCAVYETSPQLDSYYVGGDNGLNYLIYMNIQNLPQTCHIVSVVSILTAYDIPHIMKTRSSLPIETDTDIT